MKSVALILLCAAAQAITESNGLHPNSCPKDWSVEKLLPHRNCNQFYQCWDGKLVVHTCPSNLHFSIDDNRCEWAHSVDCKDREVPDGDNNGSADDKPVGGGNFNPAEAPSICAAEGSENVLVAHEKCNKYYVCNGGKPVALRCPASLLFNPNTDQCDWPQNVKCGDRVIPDEDNSGNGDGGNDNGGNGGNGDSGNDNGSDGGNGNGDSNDKPSGGGNCNPAEAPSICAAEGSENVLVAHEKCNKYYICNGGKPVALRCPANLFFNPNTDQCDWPQNVECGDRVIPDGDNSGNGDGGNENGGNGGNGDGGNDNGSDSGNGNGDSNEKPSGGGNCNPAEAPSICAAEGSEDVLVAHEKCNKFYVCNGGKPVALRCPANLFFNPNTDQCDWPQNVECGDRVIPDGDNSGNGVGGNDNESNGGNGNGDSNDKPSGGGNCNPGEAPSICAAEGSENVLVAHEKCNKYYVCNGGKPVALRCPANLFFNPNTDQCDWPQNVECGDRVIPDGDNSGNGDGGNENGGNGGNGDGENDNGSDGGNGNGDSNDKPSGGGNCNPAEAPSICAAEGSEDVLVAHEKCNKFYVCNGGKPVALRCPANLLFNPNTDQCDWPQNVECGDRVIPDGDNSGNGDGGNDNGGNGGNGDGGNDNGSDGGNGNGDSNDKPSGGGNCNPAEAPSICAAEGSENVLVAHEKCNKFYVCNGGKPVALRCPANLFFNPNTDQCDWPQNVECGDRVIPDGDNSGNGDGGNDNGGNGGNGDGGNDNGSNGGNGNGDSNDKPSGGGNCNPAEAPSICAAEGSENVLVAHEKCNKYYVCNGGKPVALRCPANLFFNPNTDQCDWPRNVECGDRVIPDDNSGNGDGGNDNGGNGGNGDGGNDNGSNGGNGNGDSNDKPSGGGNCNPAEAPSICAAEGSEDVLVAHEKCNKFYVCNGGKPVALRCPANLLFNPNTDQCDWPQNVECGDRVIPDGDNSGNGDDGNDNGGNGGNGDGGNDNGSNGGNGNGDSNDKPSGGGNCNPAEASSICAAEGSEDVLVAHEKCNKYYVCNGGKPVALRCPANLLFNPNTDQCDWPQNVECGDRVIPDGDNSGNGDGGNDNGGNGGNGDGGNDNGSNGGNGNGDSNDKPSGGGNCNPAEAPSICAAEGSEDVLVAHEKCNKYYVCNGGKPVALRCPANLLFNPNTDQCDWPQNVECGDRIIPDGDNSGNGDDGNDNGGNGGNGDGGNDNGSNGGNGNGDSNDKPSGGGNCNPAEAPSICAAEGSEDVLVAHEKCNKYYVCNGGKPVALRCPANLLFNPNTDQCDWPQNVECGDRVIPDGDNSGNGDGGNDNGGNGGNGDGGNDNGSNGGNGNGDSNDKPSGGGNCNPAEAPSICAAEGSEDVLVAHEKCNKYYVCNGGKPVALRCPANLLFNPNTDQCDWPQNVECGDRVIPDWDNSGNGAGGNDNGGNGGNGDGGNDNGGNENGGNDNGSNGGNGNGDSNDKPSGGGNCNPAEAPSICAAEGSEDVLVAHEKCNKYYVCNGGKPVALRCPANLLFNPNTDQCDWPRNVECGDRVIPDGGNSGNGDSGSDNGNNGDGDSNDKPSGGGNANPADAPSICAAEGSEDVLVAHEKCNKYYVCNGGKPVALRCPANLLFNPNTDQCDWPRNVECGDRVIPDGGNSGNGDSGSDNGNNGDGDSSDKPSGGGNANPAEAPSICAAEGSEDVLVAHEKCNKYYVCNGGKPVALRCPANLFFNPNTDQCDWAQNVECGDRVIPDGDNSGNGDGGNDNGGNGSNGGNGNGDSNDKPSGGGNCNPAEAPSICAAEGSENVLVAHEKCNKYYVCNGGKPVALRCPANLLFNPNTDQCDWPRNVECGDRVIPDGGNSGNGDSGSDNGNNGDGDSNDKPSGGGNANPADAPSICAAEGSEDVLVAHEKCNKFYVCNGGKPVVLRCPSNLLFDPNTDQCEWPQNVKCGDRVVPGGDNSGNGDGGSDNGENGNDNSGNDNGDSNDKPSEGGNSNPAEAPSICAVAGSEDVLVAHEKCNKYYICSGGKPIVRRCPAPLFFNPSKDLCDWPLNVQCGNTLIPGGDPSSNEDSENSESSSEEIKNSNENTESSSEKTSNENGESNNGSTGGDENAGDETKPSGGGNSNPSQAPSICAGHGSENVLVAHESCNKFYVCNGGKPVDLRCPGNLHFNPNTDQCDWPQNVDCGDRVISGGDNSENGNENNNEIGGENSSNKPSGGGNSDPSVAPSICAGRGSNDVLIAHETCNKYYVCCGGKPIVRSCPAPLLFNPLTDHCDWPRDVKCGDRVVSVENDNGSNDNNGNAEDKPSGSGNTNPSEAPLICAASASEDVLVAHEECNKFYICQGGKPVTLSCPLNLLFNPNTDQCDWPQNVECEDNVVPGDNGNGDGGNTDGENGESNDNSDNNANNENELVCENASNGADNSDPSQAQAICTSRNSEGVLVAHEYCNQFYLCAHGKPVAFNCPSNLLFNPKNDKCEWSHCVECGNRIISGDEDKDVENVGIGNDDPSKAFEICALEDSEDVLVAHKECNKFYVCQAGSPVALSCPLNLLFQPALNQCDWPENVNCRDRIIPTTSLNKHSRTRKTLNA